MQNTFGASFVGNVLRIFSANPYAGMRAPGPLAATDAWGVSDPAGRPWGRVCDPQAGSLTPHLCCDTRAGAFSGRRNAPPVSDDRTG
jgi:hypothetical protein